MSLFVSFFVLLIAVAVSNILARLVPKISRTYINVLMGIVVAAIPFTNHLVLTLNSDVFMLIILAPLLFFEAQRTPILMVRKRIPSILGSAGVLAIGSAAVATVILSGTFGLTLPIALVMIAICTPTDATALDSVTTGRTFPAAIKSSLKMESLFNDASGIVLLQAALLWRTTGHLGLLHNIGALLWSAGGGALLGALLAGGFALLRQSIVRSSVNVVSSQNLFYVLTPLVIYLIAEEAGVSGIIAVVTAGLIHNSEASRSRFAAPRQMHLGIQTINFMDQILNGFVFVILGLNLERIFAANYTQVIGSFDWLLIGIVAYLALFICRWLYARFLVGDKSNRTATLFALGGVHGTVTLAMTFSLTTSHLGTATFNLILLVETVVIILSMLLPTLIFRWWLPVDLDERNRNQQTTEVRHKMVLIGVEAVQNLSLPSEVRNLVIYDIKDQDQHNKIGSFVTQWRRASTRTDVLSTLQSVEQRRALMAAFTAERTYLYDLARRHVVSSTVVYDLYSEILLAESLVLDPQNQLI
ncbi:cation:proton antiporter [Levilactobacillus fujinensis]|uniref:Cation:proton antiporter n=1 Tax=Levilactobacillus fujinensis TaxID=2486024 RepID=A0ABW1TEV5_9LACO|nr:cation:proton antiporter [Levilactobacillus fujinensis]